LLKLDAEREVSGILGLRALIEELIDLGCGWKN
jgi:hypothetical protein